jgi:hypothetical protein
MFCPPDGLSLFAKSSCIFSTGLWSTKAKLHDPAWRELIAQ